MCLCVRKSGTRKHLKAWIPLGRRGERNTANQLANCCPLFESTTTKRFSRLLSSFRSLCNCVGQDETPSRLYPARLIETGTTLDSLERRAVFQEGHRPPPWCWNDRWNVANYWILKDRVRRSWQETRRIYKENRVLKSTSSTDCSFMVRSIC